MFKDYKKKVENINDELEDADYISDDLLEKFHQLENELEEGVRMCFEYEKEKMEKLLKKIKRIKESNDIF
jgi:hypothetical protein